MATQQNPPISNAAADLPQPAPTLAPDAVVEQLRAIRAQMGEVTPLTSSERQQLLRRAKTSNPVCRRRST